MIHIWVYLPNINHIYIYIYTHVYIYTCTCIYIYINKRNKNKNIDQHGSTMIPTKSKSLSQKLLVLAFCAAGGETSETWGAAPDSRQICGPLDVDVVDSVDSQSAPASLPPILRPGVDASCPYFSCGPGGATSAHHGTQHPAKCQAQPKVS